MTRGKLVLIVGMSGSGKSELGNVLITKELREKYGRDIPVHPEVIEDRTNGEEEVYYDELRKVVTNHDEPIFFAPKYVTRKPRTSDTDAICVEKEELVSKCDTVISGYKQGEMIGINIEEIMKEIDEGKFPVVVTGFPELLHLILNKFYLEGRINDVYIVGIMGHLKTVDEYRKLHAQRHNKDESSLDHSVDLDSQMRKYKSGVLARILVDYKTMFDCYFNNYLWKYSQKKDLSDIASAISLDIENISKLHAIRSDEQIYLLREFIKQDLSLMEPITGEEIRKI